MAKVKPPAVLTSPAGKVEVAPPPAQKGEVAGQEKPKEVRQEQVTQAPSAAPPPSGEGMILLGRPPTYPKSAQGGAWVEGVVQLAIWVKAEGELSAVRVARSSGDVRLDDAARLTVANEWRFKPAKQDYRILVSVEFRGGKSYLRFEGLEMGSAPPPPGEEKGEAKGGSTP
ncbi:MAG: TonB family protein [Bacillota bacterium]|nr:TonB family protein [Bacillota bacterium]